MSVHRSFVIADLAFSGAPGTLAVRDGSRKATYAQLERASNRVANGLTSFGLERQDHVAFIGKNSVFCVELLIGAAKAGMVLTIANWRLHPSELDYVLRDSEAKIVFVAEDLRDTLPSPLPKSVREVVVVGDGEASWTSWPDAQVNAPGATPPAPGDVALQLYTSGTTGRPKGAMLTNAAIAATIPDTADVWQLDETSVVLCVLPMFHIAGVGTALGALWRGGCLIIENDASPAATLADVVRFGVTNLILASVMLQGLVEATPWPETDLSTLRTVSYGAAPITEHILKAAIERFDCRLLQVYGLTETTGVLALLDDDDHAGALRDTTKLARLRSCGRARPGVVLKVVDTETGLEVAPGEVGELWAQTERLMEGYWNAPEATADVLRSNGWFRTGDLGHIDDEGYIFLHDRLKDMIVSGGENIYPAEVEAVLQDHPSVAEVAVISVPDDRWGETPIAFVVPAPGHAVDEGALIEFSRSKLAHYKCPRSVVGVDALPRNASGKVLRRTLRDPYWAGSDRRIN